jgi:carboxyl-terminal processing protease
MLSLRFLNRLFITVLTVQLLSQAPLHGSELLVAKARSQKTSLQTKTGDNIWPDVATVAAALIETQHYLRQPLDASFSKRALDRYFDALDPDRLYFRANDVSEMQSRFGSSFAALLKAGNLEAVNVLFDLYTDRVTAFCHTVMGLAGGHWEFTSEWGTELARDKASRPSDDSEAQQLWIAQVGAELLEYRLDGMSDEKATAQVQKRVANLLSYVKSAQIKDRLSPALLALARACDAHSDYLTQEEMEDTENEMRLTRIGIGVTLDSDPSGLRVASLMPGGPAQRDGRLRVNDRIVAVAEDTGNFRELDGLPMSRALTMLKGQRNTIVRLKVIPARASDPAQRVIIGIRREEMRSVDGEAYGKIIQYPREPGIAAQRLGWLVVPAFYGDEPNVVGHRASSVSRDVGLLLRRMEAEKIEGLVLDFRGNLGGLLDEAVEIGGLFCGRVPIAQVRAPDAETEILKPLRMRSQKAVYSGPLVVLTDRNSASASELVAGALQDYARALVVGGEQTFGKGSVQTTVPLSEYLGANKALPVGGLALTVGKFYRVSGQSTQLLGVKPDIILPSTLDLPNEGEAALVDPLAHDAIQSLATQNPLAMPVGHVEKVREKSSLRITESKAFSDIISERDAARRERAENRLNLLETDRRSALERAHQSYAQREESLGRASIGAKFCRLLLEDTKQKRLKFLDDDPLASHDPEFVATENEVLEILKDLVGQSSAP